MLPLLLSISRPIHFQKRMHGFGYLYCRDRVQITLEGIEIFPTEDSYRFPCRALDGQECQTDREGDRLC